MLSHQQFNSPIALYSRENVNDVYQKSLAALNPKHPSAHNYAGHTETYRLLHNKEALPPHHSVRYEEPSREDYPHYQGFVDPNLQSPSFRRLQYITGLTPDTEQAEVYSSDSVTVHHEGATHQETKLNSNPMPSTRSDVAHARQPPPPPPPMTQSGIRGGGMEHVSAYKYEPKEYEKKDEMDERLAQKLAEAERPKVPQMPTPLWAHAARQKHAKWEERNESPATADGGHNPPSSYMANAGGGAPQLGRYSAEPIRPGTLPRPSSVTPAMMSSSSSLQHRYDSFTERPRSSKSESWLKVCVAPNLEQLDHRAKYNTWRGESQRYHNDHGRRSRDAYEDYATASLPLQQRKHVNISSLVSGQAEKPPPPVRTVPPWHKAAETKHSKWQQQMDRLEPNVQAKQRPQPSWARRAEQKQHNWQRQGDAMDPYSNRPRVVADQRPSWAKRAEQTQTLWRNEADAWNERKRQEAAAAAAGFADRFAQSTRIGEGDQPPWRRQQRAGRDDGQPLLGREQYDTSATGDQHVVSGLGTTKMFSTGTFYDDHGQKVDFRKEAYSSVDPSNQYSMSKEHEEAVVERPSELGAPVKRTVQKYYKKTTHTSRTTTRGGGTDLRPSLMSNASMRQHTAPSTTMPGSISAHESQF